MALRLNTRFALLLALTAAFVGIAVVVLSHRDDRDAQEVTARPAIDAADTLNSTTNSVTSSANLAGSEPEEAVQSTKDNALPEGSIGDTYAALVRLAEAGNGPAAVRLAHLMVLCATYVPKSREDAEQEIVDGMAAIEPPRTEEEAREHDAIVAIAVSVQDRQHSACPGFSTLGIDDPLAEQRRWTEVAAALGEARAIVDIASTMIKKYKSPGDIVEHAEELRLLRPQAMALLQRAAETGEPAALIRMAAAHRTGDLAPIDAVEAYAWMLAYQAGPPAPDFPTAALERMLVLLEAPLNQRQREAARRRADEIRARCCLRG